MTEQTKTRQVAVVQDGARRHYAVPAALARAGLLGAMYTDLFLAPGTRTTAWQRMFGWAAPSWRARLDGRRHADIPGAKVIDFPVRAAFRRLVGRLNPGRFANPDSQHRLQAAVLRRSPPPAQANVLYAFVPCTSPAALTWARERGMRIVGDQIIAPFRLQSQLLEQSLARYPEWRGYTRDAHLSAAAAIEEASWPLCDAIVCGSPFVRDRLIDRGLAPDRIAIAPPPLNITPFPNVDRSARKGPITVGFLGQVGLRKGAPDLLAAAEKLAGRDIRFELVGDCAAPPSVLAQLNDHVQVLPPIPRSQVPALLSRWDLFALPSHCEGSANAINEAMAAGLPIICTPNCGSRVVDGEHGFIVPAADPEALAERIDQLAADRDLRLTMGKAGRQRVSDYTLDDYGRTLAELVRQLPVGPEPSRDGP